MNLDNHLSSFQMRKMLARGSVAQGATKEISKSGKGKCEGESYQQGWSAWSQLVRSWSIVVIKLAYVDHFVKAQAYK